jgi:putative ABC transport system permease protein
MSLVSRGVRNAFRSPTRTVAVVVILCLTIGLSFVMLVGHKSVENKLSATLASLGTTVNIAPTGYATGSTNNSHLRSTQLKAVARLPHVVNLAEALPDGLRSGRTAAETSLLPASAGERVAFVGTNAPTQPSNIGASTLRLVAGHAIDGTGDADDAMVSTTMAQRNHLQVGSTFRAYNAVFAVKAIFSSDTANGNDTVIMPLTIEQRLSHRDDEVMSAVATVDSLTNLSAVTGAITATLGPAADVTSDVAHADQAIAPLKSVKSLSLYSLFGSIGTATVIIFLVMVMTVRERKREVGTMKAIGGSNASIVYQFMAEALTLATLGGAAGIVGGALGASSITSSLIAGNVKSTSPGNTSAGYSPTLRHLAQVHATATVPEVLVGLAGILVIAALGSGAASYLISRIQPAEALRSE